MAHSDQLFYVYAIGAAVTIIVGLWLSHRSKIETPVFLTLLTSHEFLLIMFALFWPILGPAVLLEIVLRGWVRRRSGGRVPTDDPHREKKSDQHDTTI